jgi:hypothetical protein
MYYIFLDYYGKKVSTSEALMITTLKDISSVKDRQIAEAKKKKKNISLMAS